MEENKQLTVVAESYSVQEVGEQVHQIQALMKEFMQQGTHFGVIPGCGNKPTLLKAGAEKLCFMFRLSPNVETEVIEMKRDHREYRVKCTLIHIGTGAVIAQGMGSCTTMESKYRYRKGEENDNPADFYNTCLKMAEKRAKVNAALSGTAASDIFTQDIEDMRDIIGTPTKSASVPDGKLFSYKIDYNDTNSRQQAKDGGCRWNKEDKTWDGPFIEALSSYIVGGGEPDTIEPVVEEAADPNPQEEQPPVDVYDNI